MSASWPHGHFSPFHSPIGHWPFGHWPPDSLSTTCDLYRLWPLIVRAKSLFASGLLDETDTQESILKKLTYALEMECATTREQLQGLVNLVNVDSCPSQYLTHLAAFIMSPYLDSWSLEKRRVVIKGTVCIWLRKGLRCSWKSLFDLFGHSQVDTWELWKADIYEDFDYSPYRDYYHQLRAARVDLVRNSDPYDRVDYQIAFEQMMPLIESVRPIHVLLRRFAQEWNLPDDYVSVPCDSSCEVGCETSNETADFFDSSSAAVSSEDNVPIVTDGVSVELTCITWCEAQCEGAGCETGGCQAGSCETSCQGVCDGSCQGGINETCQISSCQTGCEMWSCEVGCETGCETGCEIGCQTGCEGGCETTCEPSPAPCSDCSGTTQVGRQALVTSALCAEAEGIYTFTNFSDLGTACTWLYIKDEVWLEILYEKVTGVWCVCIFDIGLGCVIAGSVDEFNCSIGGTSYWKCVTGLIHCCDHPVSGPVLEGEFDLDGLNTCAGVTVHVIVGI